MGVEYCVELFSPDANWGPGTLQYELWGAKNIGWARYDRLSAKAFLTLAQNDPGLKYINKKSHVRITRCSSAGNHPVFAGILVNYNSTGDDAVVEFADYTALLSLSRCGFKTMYTSKQLGTEIVSPEFDLAKAATGSLLGFVTKGTIEDPLGDDNVTIIKTDTQFGLMDQSRLRLFYDLSEMGRANTDNHVTFGISRTSPYTFSFLKNSGTIRSFGLDLNGRVVNYSYTPNWTHYRNDLATLAQDAAGGAAEIIAKDAAEIAAYGLHQDQFSISTLLGLAGSTVTADQQQAAAARMLKRGILPPPSVALQIRQGGLNPGSGQYEIGDKAPVQLVIGLDNINALWRIVGEQGFMDEGGEKLTVMVTP